MELLLKYFYLMNSKKKNILLVEDDANLGSLLKDYLSLKGYIVTRCLDGEVGKNILVDIPIVVTIDLSSNILINNLRSSASLS